MPLLMISSSSPVPEGKRKELLAAASKIVAESTGKPEKYVMVTLVDAGVMMAGKEEPAAFADVRSIGGLEREVNQTISQKLGELFQKKLEIPPARVYITFTEVPAANWGYDGGTFG